MSSFKPNSTADPLLKPSRILAARFGVFLMIIAALMSSSIPTLLYPVYQDHWRTSTAWTSVMFATYAIAVIGALICSREIEKYFRDRKVLIYLAGFCICTGLVIAASAHGPGTMLAGRALCGLGTGCLMGCANAALYELDPHRSLRSASLYSTLAFTLGSGIGPLLSGYCLNKGLSPLSLPYMLACATCMVAIVLVGRTPMLIPRAVSNNTGSHARLDKQSSKLFWVAAWALVTGWCVGSVFMACGAKIVRDLAHIDDPLIGALLVSAFQLTAGMGQILGRFTSSFTSVTIGVSVVCTGQLGMAAAASSGMAIFFSLACAVAGVGYGVAFEGANSLVSSIARLESRSWLASKFYIYGYIFGNVVPSLATGLLTDVFGLLTALSSFTAVVAGMSVVCLILVRRAAKCTS